MLFKRRGYIVLIINLPMKNFYEMQMKLKSDVYKGVFGIRCLSKARGQDYMIFR